MRAIRSYLGFYFLYPPHRSVHYYPTLHIFAVLERGYIDTCGTGAFPRPGSPSPATTMISPWFRGRDDLRIVRFCLSDPGSPDLRHETFDILTSHPASSRPSCLRAFAFKLTTDYCPPSTVWSVIAGNEIGMGAERQQCRLKLGTTAERQGGFNRAEA